MSDDRLFSKINSNSLHILQQFMPDRPSVNYSLRARPHNKTLIAKTTQLNDQDFIIEVSIKTLIDYTLNISIHHHSNRALYLYYCPYCEQFYLFLLLYMVAFVNLYINENGGGVEVVANESL